MKEKDGFFISPRSKYDINFFSDPTGKRLEAGVSYSEETRIYSDQVRIYFIQSGSFHFETDAVTYSLSEGNMLLVAPWQIHQLICKTKECSYQVITFDPALPPLLRQIPHLDTDLAYWINNTWKTHTGYLTLNETQRKKTAELIAKYDSHKGFTMDILRFSTLLELLCEICIFLKRTSSLRNGAGIEGSVSDRAIQYIEQNYRRPIHIHDIAEALFVTESYLRNVFRRETGFNLKEYINHRRINEAKLVLRDIKKKPLDAFLASGFADYSNFLRMFQKIEHCSPSEYQKEYIRLNPEFKPGYKGKYTNKLPEECE